VTFSISNLGQGRHNFHVAGKSTATLAAGTRATLRVVFGKPGSYPYAALGLPHSGALHVIAGAAATLQPAPTSTVATTIVATPCTNPTTTTVNVTLTDTMGQSGFTFSPASVPCGTVSFVITNVGQDAHIRLTDPHAMTAPAVPILPSQTVRAAVTLNLRGKYGWYDGLSEGYETAGLSPSNDRIVEPVRSMPPGHRRAVPRSNVHGRLASSWSRRLTSRCGCFWRTCSCCTQPSDGDTR
jgi:hypothetical protein